MLTPTIEIVIIYDDERTRARALRAQAHLMQEFGSSLRLHFSSFSFKSLWHPKMMRMATKAAIEADIIIFSVLLGRDLPQLVKSWIEEWATVSNRVRPTALALLETASPVAPRTSVARFVLGETARRCGMDFVASSSDEDRESSDALRDCLRDSNK